MHQTEQILQLINEELSKNEVSSLINSKISSNLSSKDFERKVREIAVDIIKELYKSLWQNNSNWTNAIKK